MWKGTTPAQGLMPSIISKLNMSKFYIFLLIAFIHTSLMGQKSFDWMIQPEFEAIVWCGDGLVKTKKNGRYGLTDTSGQTIIAPKYADIAKFHEQYAAVLLDSKYGFINKKGDVEIPIQYDFVIKFSEGKAAVKTKGLFGFVNTRGTFVIQPAFQHAGSFKEGLALVMNEDRKWGYIDTVGKLVIPFMYDEANDFNSGMAKVVQGGVDSYITYETTYYQGMDPEKKKTVEATIKKRAALNNAFGHTGRMGSGSAGGNYFDRKASKSLGKWGIKARQTDAWVVEPQFDDLELLAPNWAKAKLNGYWGLFRIR